MWSDGVHDVRVRLAEDGRSGWVIASPHGSVIAVDATSDEFGIWRGGWFWTFTIPKRHWWQRSLETAVFKAIAAAQQRTEQNQEAEERVTAVKEGLDNLRDALGEL